MLWNAIYGFFVKYIFGGFYYENGVYSAHNALFSVVSWNESNYYNTVSIPMKLFGYDISFGNYLSLIATLISMVVIVLLCCLFIKKIYNMCAHIIG